MKKRFGLQWHITTACDQHCKHCYMFDSEYYPKEKANELELNDMKKVLYDLVESCLCLDCTPHISFTGGDPLLKPELFPILEEINKIKESGIEFELRILGNPYHLDKETAKDLFKLGVNRYQISIDGMEKTHDMFRKKGSFASSLKALSVLSESGIKSNVMFSLSKTNAEDIFPLIKLLGKTKANVFSFARIAPNGSNKNVFMGEKELISPEDYREFLIRVDSLFEQLNNNGSKLTHVYKDHLWKLLHYEQGKLQIDKDSSMIYCGCSMGINSLSVLADGTVYACRRFISPIGKIPEQPILDIFLGERLSSYRDVNSLKKCSQCELINYCRGCPAIAWGHYGSHTEADPQCWKSV